ncbi:MAG: hypothetical protein AAF441_24540, partial [Pseudomonadota bacterium]
MPALLEARPERPADDEEGQRHQDHGDRALEEHGRDAFRYSGGGYTLMQLLVEEVTGETFNAVAHRTFIGPLGMT